MVPVGAASINGRVGLPHPASASVVTRPTGRPAHARGADGGAAAGGSSRAQADPGDAAAVEGEHAQRPALVRHDHLVADQRAGDPGRP